MWVLIIVMMNLSKGIGDVQIVEFTSQEKCEVALATTIEMKRGFGSKNLQARCVEK